MTDYQVYAWILLSVPERGGNLSDLIAKADTINHAIPTHDELQRSLGWLKKQGLVNKEDRSAVLTNQGISLLARFRKPRQSSMKMWDKITAALAERGEAEAPFDDITIEELKRAYATYNKEFWRRYRELNKQRK